jgi:hypothetical protein
LDFIPRTAERLKNFKLRSEKMICTNEKSNLVSNGLGKGSKGELSENK